MEYEEAITWLYGTQLFGIKLGLENVRRLCDAWELPGSNGKILHVAGTNGKGSVCAMAASICRAAGYRTGRYTSPHLVTFRERITVEGTLIGESETAARLTELRDLTRDWDPHPTFFELTTVLALRHFKERAVDVTVLETGMGGKLDATNIVTPAVSVITPIALDHEKWLGDSLAAIAGEKAGIIKRGVPVVSARQAPEAAEVLRRGAAEMETRVRFVEKPWNVSEVGLPGAHQRENAALAVAALEEAGIDVPGKAIREGLASVGWRARFERLAMPGGGELILDGAHNPDATEALAETWREVFGDEKATIIFGAVESKDVEGMLRHLSPLAERIIFTAVNSPRTVAPEKLAQAAKGGFADSEIAPDAAAALETAARGGAERILVTGSLFLVGEVLTLLGESANTVEKSAQ